MRRVPIVTALLLAPAIAHGSNAATPRTPPVFKLQACLSVVDRSVDPVFHLDFAIPYEDQLLTEDEPADARRFQFFALCRDHDAQETLPSWIALADAEAALAAGAIDELPPEQDVLADHPAWPSACVQPMNAADDRIPITCDATAGGLDFDTTGMPAGNAIVYGYTHAPALNLWTPRAGLLRVTDGDDAAIDPVVSLMSPLHEATAYTGSGYRILGCMA